MRRIFIWTAAAGSFIAGVRISPGFSSFWKTCISLPLLRCLARIGEKAPFVILEWFFPALCVFLLISILLRRFIRNLLRTVLVIVSLYLGIWCPLYSAPQPIYSASPVQLAASCERLIDELNAAGPDFSSLPELPAKFARFPGWMDALNISGFCSFFTGEALVSPELSSSSLPFVAVHEQMHLQGIAGEGAANIAAWEDCMARGGLFAESAKLWALRYSMGLLRGADSVLYERCRDDMSSSTLRLYNESGGTYIPVKESKLEIMLGIRQDYEILAHYLAAETGR